MVRAFLFSLPLAECWRLRVLLRSRSVLRSGTESRAQGVDDKQLTRPNNVTCYGGIA